MKNKKIYWKLGGGLEVGIVKYRNLKVRFNGSDTKTQYESTYGNLDVSPVNFDYKFNSYGFRSQEFNLTESKPIILTLGCSFTVGTGVPCDKNWPEQFKDRYFPNHCVWNAGINTASADTVARLAVNIIPVAKPDIVAVLWPRIQRFETYTEFQPSQHGPLVSDMSQIENDLEYNFQYSNENIYNNQAKNKIIVDLLQKVYGFKLLSIDWDDTVNNVYREHKWTKARDGIHYGVDWHQQIADDFYLQYTNPEEFALKYADPDRD